MQPGDLFVGAFVHEQPIGKSFTEWPLHVTVVSWARSSQHLQALVTELSERLDPWQPFEAEVGEEALFVNDTVLVNLVKQPSEFNELFKLVKAAESKVGLEFVSTNHPVYKPHVTVQASDRCYEGDTFLVDRLYVVEQKGNFKEVVSEVSFGKAAA